MARLEPAGGQREIAGQNGGARGPGPRLEEDDDVGALAGPVLGGVPVAVRPAGHAQPGIGADDEPGLAVIGDGGVALGQGAGVMGHRHGHMPDAVREDAQVPERQGEDEHEGRDHGGQDPVPARETARPGPQRDERASGPGGRVVRGRR